MLLFIKTNWGGSSVPVALTFGESITAVKGLAKDVNWSNAYLDWIDLAHAKTAGTVTRAIPNTTVDYTVIYDVHVVE